MHMKARVFNADVRRVADGLEFDYNFMDSYVTRTAAVDV